MQIEEQIKTLLKIKAKIDLFQKLITNIKAEISNPDEENLKFIQEHPGVLEDFIGEIVAFAEQRIEELGNGKRKTPEFVPDTFEKVTTPAPINKPVVEDANLEPKDPLKFLLKYRHFDNKRVTFESKDGKVSGVVRGLVTPFLKVETDTGFVINVDPKTVSMET